MATVDTLLNDLINPGIRTANRRRQNQPFPEDQETSIVDSLRRGSMGTLAAVGNVLDLPGSSVRDALAGENPLDQWLPWNWTSPEGRTTGRDLSRQMGLAGRRDTTGNFWGGLGMEVALDPLTYMTLGASALGKAGKSAKAKGLMDELPKVAAWKAEKPLGEIGKRQARVSTTLDDFMKYGQDVADKTGKTDILDTVTDVLKSGVNPSEPLGGLVGLGLPFKAPSKVLGQGAVKTASAMDAVGGAIRHSPVVDPFARLFGAALGDAKTKFGQAVNKMAFRDTTKAMARPNTMAAHMARRMGQAGLTDPESGRLLRDVVEGVADPNVKIPAEITEIAGEMKDHFKQLKEYELSHGMATAEMDDWLDDVYVDYMARFGSEMKGKGTDSKVMSTFDRSTMGRSDILRDVQGGTRVIVDVVKDPEIEKIAEAAAGLVGADKRTAAQSIAEVITRKYGNKISDTYRKLDPDTGELVDAVGRHEELGKMILSLPEGTRKAGLFGNNPILDFQGRSLAGAKAITNVEALKDALSQPGILSETVDSEHRLLREMIKETGLKWGNDTAEGFGDRLADMMGTTRKELSQMRISKKHADDLTRLVQKTNSPEALNEIIGFVDNVTNLSKGLWTSAWPAFHTRNRVSGMVHNFMLGISNIGAEKDAFRWMRGQGIADAQDIKAVQQEWAKRGGTGALDNKTANEILSDLIYGHGVLGKYEVKATDITGEAAAKSGGDIQDVLGNLTGPGNKPVSFRKALKKSVGMEPGTSLNPLKSTARGVRGEVESTWGPLAAGEDIGHFVEGWNRIAPMLNLLRKGHSAAEAAERVGTAQVMYGGRYYTKFEREKMKRLFPFYSFTSRVAPQVVKELMEHPGGRLGQLVRTQRLSQDQGSMAPDYVRETASIPFESLGGLEKLIGQAPEGTDRYITGLGLMHEDPLSIGPGGRGTMLEMASRTNPFIKAPLEWMTGQNFFQKGPEGGRDLADVDPVVGRLASNLGLTDGPTKDFLPDWMEQVASNSPVARALTTARTLSDDRKQWPVRLMNTLTGLRVSDISPANKDAMIRDLLQKAEKDLGAATFENIYFRDKDLDRMDPDQREQAEVLEAYARVLQNRAKRRAMIRRQAE